MRSCAAPPSSQPRSTREQTCDTGEGPPRFLELPPAPTSLLDVSCRTVWGVCCSIDQAVHLKDLVILARHRNELESEIEDASPDGHTVR